MKEETGKQQSTSSLRHTETAVNVSLTWPPDVFTLVLSCLTLSSIAAALP